MNERFESAVHGRRARKLVWGVIRDHPACPGRRMSKLVHERMRDRGIPVDGFDVRKTIRILLYRGDIVHVGPGRHQYIVNPAVVLDAEERALSRLADR